MVCIAANHFFIKSGNPEISEAICLYQINIKLNKAYKLLNAFVYFFFCNFL